MLDTTRQKYFERMVSNCYLQMVESLDDDVTDSEFQYFLSTMMTKISTELSWGLRRRAKSKETKSSDSEVDLCSIK